MSIKARNDVWGEIIRRLPIPIPPDLIPIPPDLIPIPPDLIPVIIPGAGKLLEELLLSVTKELTTISSTTLENLRANLATSSGPLALEVNKAIDAFETEMVWMAEDVDRKLQRGKENLDRAATAMKEDLATQITRAKEDLDREATRAKGSLDREATNLKEELDRELTRVNDDISDELTRQKKKLDDAATRIKEDTARELTSAREDVDEAVKAATKFVQVQLDSAQQTLSETEKKLREGKVLDAMWHLATEPVRDTKDDLATALTESSLLNQIATVAVTTYGGPAGAAAYAAWLAYETTGSLDYALRAGLIAGATVAGGEVVREMASATLTDLVKRELVQASLNAGCVAASGGTRADVEEAFMGGITKAGDLVKIQYQTMVQEWVVTSVATALDAPTGARGPDYEEAMGVSLVKKAQALKEGVDKFSKQWKRYSTRASLRSRVVGEIVGGDYLLEPEISLLM
tara:strand:- start:8004 stop:9386 length:1383 start_codon:yes stop_codon:yes gene_type:complete